MPRHSHVHSQNCRCVYCPGAQRAPSKFNGARPFLTRTLRAYARAVPPYLVAMLIALIVSHITGIR